MTPAASGASSEKKLRKVRKARAVEATHDLREAVITALGSGLSDPRSIDATVGDMMAARRLLTLMLDLLPDYPRPGRDVIDVGEPARAAMTSEEPAPSWPRLLAAAGPLWLSGHLLPVAKRSRSRRVTLAVLWAGDRCAELARWMLAVR